MACMKTSHILIADDQPGILLLLKEILEAEGYEVTTVKTGKEALQATQSNEYHLIILDYRLPIINGMEIVKKLDQSEMMTPIIMMSGLLEHIMHEMEQYEQIVATLAKPFDIAKAIELVKEKIAEYQ